MTRHNVIEFDNLLRAQSFTRLLNDALATEQPGLPLTLLAQRLGATYDTTKRWLNTACGGNNYPAFLLPAWYAHVGDQVPQDLAYQMGCTLVTLPSPADSPTALVEVVGQVQEGTGSLVRQLVPGLVTGQYPYAVQRRIRTSVQQTIAMLMHLERLTCSQYHQPQAERWAA